MRQALYILADLDEQDLTWLVRAGRHEPVAPGTSLIREGEPIEYLYIVTEGRLEVVIGGGARVAERGVGDLLGEMSLIEKQLPSATVKALDGVRVLAIPQAALRERLRSDLPFAARFYRALAILLADRLRELGAKATKPGDEDAAERFAREHELDEGLLDTLHVAGDRLRRLLKLLEVRPS